MSSHLTAVMSIGFVAHLSLFPQTQLGNLQCWVTNMYWGSDLLLPAFYDDGREYLCDALSGQMECDWEFLGG